MADANEPPRELMTFAVCDPFRVATMIAATTTIANSTSPTL